MVDFNSPEYRAIILAAFLHDIGKFIGRFESEQLDRARHPEFSALFISSHSQLFGRYCDAALLRELVQKHHESNAFPEELRVQSIVDPHVRSLAKVVSVADNLSSSERGDATSRTGYYKKTPLCSVIERLNSDPGKDDILKFRPLALPSTLDDRMQKCIFPEAFSVYESGELNRHIEAFGREFEQYAKVADEKISFSAFISYLNNIIYKYAWCIPSNTQEDYPDVSLYDHLKISAAIAACLYQYHTESNSLNEKAIGSRDSNRFYIVAGDVSGIQAYIFGVTGAGGIAKKLRARSLVVQTCSDIAVNMILKRFGLPLWNNILSAGGNFYLLLPALKETSAILESFQTELDTWFREKMNGELALNLAWYMFGNDGFKPVEGESARSDSGFSNIIYEVKNELAAKKQNKFGNVLIGQKGWDEDSFIINMDFEGKGICKSCYKFPGSIIQEEIEICVDCNRQKELGMKLPRSEYLWFYATPQAGQYPLIGHSISSSDTAKFSDTPYLVMRLNNPDLSAITGLPACFKYMASYVPQGDDGVVTFEEIAGKSEGQPLLGFLKADVDNLGETFIFGLKHEIIFGPKREIKFIDTISRQATLSRLLEAFFSGWVEHLVSTRYRDCYTVFSGGDDLFYVGPWAQVLELATQINADFTCFTNGKLTLSAGVFIARPDYPIGRAAEEVNVALEKSKDSGKNSITILDNTLKWSDWENVRQEWLKILPVLQNTQQVKSSFLYRLLDFAEMWQQYLQGQTAGLRYHPLLAYDLARNLDPKKVPELCRWVEDLLKWPPDDRHKMILTNLGLIVTLCLYNRRGGKNDTAV